DSTAATAALSTDCGRPHGTQPPKRTYPRRNPSAAAAPPTRTPPSAPGAQRLCFAPSAASYGPVLATLPRDLRSPPPALSVSASLRPRRATAPYSLRSHGTSARRLLRSGEHREEAPVEDGARRPVGGARVGADDRAQPDQPAAPWQRRQVLDGDLAAQGVTLVDRAGVVAAFPAGDRDQPGQCPGDLGEREADGMAAVDEPAAAGRGGVVVHLGHVEGQPGEFRRAGHNVAAADGPALADGEVREPGPGGEPG